MYSGTMIEDLIAVVARAETQARQAQHTVESKPALVIDEPVYVPFTFETPFYAAVGAA